MPRTACVFWYTQILERDHAKLAGMPSVEMFMVGPFAVVRQMSSQSVNTQTRPDWQDRQEVSDLSPRTDLLFSIWREYTARSRLRRNSHSGIITTS
jgi:hypothetical protein